MEKELPKKYYEKLELNEFKLNSLLEITKAINNNLSIENILKIFEYILREQLGISKLILYANDSLDWNCILHFGARGLNKKINVKKLGDHRICMSSFVLASLTGAAAKIKNFETVNTSSPSFFFYTFS